MRTVKQRGENDCGVACVAMLAGVSYDEAFDAIYPSGRTKLTKTRDLHAALKSLGRNPLAERRKPFGRSKLDDLEGDALVFVELKNAKRSKHWIVWDSQAQKVKDPYPTTYRYHLRGYLIVE